MKREDPRSRAYHRSGAGPHGRSRKAERRRAKQDLPKEPRDG